jgi:hypothetical protein
MVVNTCQFFGDVVQWVVDFAGDFGKIRGLASDLGVEFFVRFGTVFCRAFARALGHWARIIGAVRYGAR